jgi:hypothetical protein
MFAVLGAAVTLFTQRAKASSWIREGPPSVAPGMEGLAGPFELKVVRCDNDHVTGLAVLTRHSPRPGYKGVSVTVGGVETDEHRFWPSVTLQYSDDLNRNWQTLEQNETAGTAAARRVDPQTPGETFFVNLDPFRPFVGRVHYGRILLGNGEDVVFELIRLQARTNARSTSASEKPSWSRRPEDLYPSFTSRPFLTRLHAPAPPLGLISVASEDTQLEGGFVYGSMQPSMQRGDVEEWALSKHRTFWPTVTAEVANDDRGEWTTIGQSSKPDKLYKPKGPPTAPVLLHVNLGLLRPLAGKYRYGRVVLETGESAIFELVNLLPPEKD